MNKNITLIVSSVAIIVSLVVTPSSVSAQSNVSAYKPQSNKEMVAYMYGRIAQLMEILAQIENGGTLSTNQNALSFDYVSLSTYRADDIETTTAVLRGEVVLFGAATASVWFEYGEDKSFLDRKTKKVNVRSAYDRAVRTKVSNLEEDEVYYYRLVTLNKDKTISYGSIYSFRTDED